MLLSKLVNVQSEVKLKYLQQRNLALDDRLKMISHYDQHGKPKLSVLELSFKKNKSKINVALKQLPLKLTVKPAVSSYRLMLQNAGGKLLQDVEE